MPRCQARNSSRLRRGVKLGASDGAAPIVLVVPLFDRASISVSLACQPCQSTFELGIEFMRLAPRSASPLSPRCPASGARTGELYARLARPGDDRRVPHHRPRLPRAATSIIDRRSSRASRWRREARSPRSPPASTATSRRRAAPTSPTASSCRTIPASSLSSSSAPMATGWKSHCPSMRQLWSAARSTWFQRPPIDGSPRPYQHGVTEGESLPLNRADLPRCATGRPCRPKILRKAIEAADRQGAGAA